MHEEIDASHGRVETRRTYVIDFKKYKKHMSEGGELSSVAMVETIRDGLY